MPRIPQAEIQRLKREVSLERLCETYGIELHKKGKNLVGFCPFHVEDEPSFVVTPEKNLWHCMGACDAGGSVFDLVMKMEKASFRRAAERLREIAGTAPPTPTLKTRRGDEHPILVDPARGPTDAEILHRVTDFYHRTFLNTPDAMKYLQDRHCFHPEAVKRFRIGYANRTLGYRIPGETLAGKRLKARLQGVGVLRKSGHEHLSGSVIFPIFAAPACPEHACPEPACPEPVEGGEGGEGDNGAGGEIPAVVQMYGRKIGSGYRKGTPLHLYLEQPMGGVWNGDDLVHQKEWIVCESILDALTLWCHGLRNVTASYGTQNFTDDHLALLRRARPLKVTIAYDNDAGGNRGAAKLADLLAAEGANMHRLELPEGLDVNAYAADLAKCDPRGVAPRLQALADTAPLVRRADLGSVSIDAGEAEPLPPLAASVADTAVCAGQPAPALPETAEEVPAAKRRVNIPCEQHGEDVTITIGDRSYRVRGLARNTSFDVMKVNLRAMRMPSSSPSSLTPQASSLTSAAEGGYHVDTLDLYNARARTAFINTAAGELGVEPAVVKKDLGKVLLKLEELQEQAIRAAMEPETRKGVTLNESERREALALLKDPRLLDRIVADFTACGVVGEETNKLVGYLAAVSRKLDEPLAVLIQSTSAAGKSRLMEAILALVPEEDRVQYSAMTGQALFYLGDMDLKHKVLAIAEEEGAERASYALKLLQSEGQLTIASTGKDPETGRMVTQEYRVEGPVMILTTTTAIDIEEELLNRCVVLTVDESRDQTRAIHRIQRERETLKGMLQKLDKAAVVKLHRNAQRLLRPLAVANPYATRLTFLDDRTRTRRDHMKYLTLIRTIALLHQYQRPVKTVTHRGRPVKVIEATLDDIAVANRLAGEVLGRSLDELSPQTRRFLEILDQMVAAECEARKLDRADCRFTQRRVREHTGWTDFQVKKHMRRLVDLEYLLTHRAARGQSFVYELLYNGEGRDGQRFLMRLLDVAELGDNAGYDGNREPPNGRREPPGSPQGAPKERPGSTPENGDNPSAAEDLRHPPADERENTRPRPIKPAASSYAVFSSRPCSSAISTLSGSGGLDSL